jgi:hypothetical protein
LNVTRVPLKAVSRLTPPVVPNGASPVDQPKGVMRESVELIGIVLTRGTLQCLDRGAAKLSRVFRCTLGFEVIAADV